MSSLRWLEKYRPHKLPFRRHVTRASVALIYRGANVREGELFFIQRARREGDPWSGDMAFPGGRLERSDTSSRHTAMRETLEETGLDLFQQGEYQSRLSDLLTTGMRGPVGAPEGRLDVAAYRASVVTIAPDRPVVLDLRQLESPWNAMQIGRQAWAAAAVGGP